MHGRQNNRVPDHRTTLLERVERFQQLFDGWDVPRPPQWSGFRIVPKRFEFWQQQPSRLHDRLIFERPAVGDAWELSRLFLDICSHLSIIASMQSLTTFDTVGIQTELMAILSGLEAPLKEYDLMLELTDRGFDGFADFGSDSFELFRAHFVLFNALYSLRQRFVGRWRSLSGDQCTQNRIYGNADDVSSALSLESDSIADYYLDWKNLHDTTREDVEAMLDSFWERFTGLDSRAEALEIMGLDESASAGDIKRRYRELALKHHPDRGGDAEAFKKVASAMKTLQR